MNEHMSMMMDNQEMMWMMVCMVATTLFAIIIGILIIIQTFIQAKMLREIRRLKPNNNYKQG